VSAAAKKRLRPGELDGLVIAYLREHEKDGPLTATAIAEGLGSRSAGAVANCLGRLARRREARQISQQPRRYVLLGKQR
jgi:hypothetical protein